MRITLDQDQINEVKNIWQTICWRMNVHRVSPKELAYQTGYSIKYIERGVVDEPAPITIDFLRACVSLFGLKSGRTRHFEETDDVLSWDECVTLLKPPPAMPPRQGNFWDYL